MPFNRTLNYSVLLVDYGIYESIYFCYIIYYIVYYSISVHVTMLVAECA